jgi:hypothetical protein
MAKKKRRRLPPKLVPRLGPATNLRPAGTHESIQRYNRKKAKAALRQEIAEGGFPFVLGKARLVMWPTRASAAARACDGTVAPVRYAATIIGARPGGHRMATSLRVPFSPEPVLSPARSFDRDGRGVNPRQYH